MIDRRLYKLVFGCKNCGNKMCPLCLLITIDEKIDFITMIESEMVNSILKIHEEYGNK